MERKAIRLFPRKFGTVTRKADMLDNLQNLFNTGGNAPDERKIAPQVFKPKITIGSIVLFALLKITALMLGGWLLIEYTEMQQYWWILILSIVLFALMPAYQQYELYREQSKTIAKNSLCASCRHYDDSGIICTIMDEHVSVQHTPCGGAGWEARHPDLS